MLILHIHDIYKTIIGFVFINTSLVCTIKEILKIEFNTIILPFL